MEHSRRAQEIRKLVWTHRAQLPLVHPSREGQRADWTMDRRSGLKIQGVQKSVESRAGAHMRSSRKSKKEGVKRTR